jgi:ribosomal protein L37E
LHLVCSKCGEHLGSDEVFEEALGRALELDAHEAAKEGLEAPLENCPECGRDTFVVSERRCANCGFSLEGYECALCSEPLSVDDYRYGDGSLCSYHAHVLSKDD